MCRLHNGKRQGVSFRRLKRRTFKYVRCEGCNQPVHPRRIMLVDPSLINVERAPLYLCGKCRSRLVWRKLEEKDAATGE